MIKQNLVALFQAMPFVKE